MEEADLILEWDQLLKKENKDKTEMMKMSSTNLTKLIKEVEVELHIKIERKFFKNQVCHFKIWWIICQKIKSHLLLF